MTQFLACPTAIGEQPANAPETATNNAEPVRVPLRVSTYNDGSGKLLRLSIALDDGVPFDVLVDTGSEGLRVFGNLLPPAMRPTQLNRLDKDTQVQFGAGAEMSGPLVRSRIHLGEVLESESPITLHWIEEMGCSNDFEDCELSSGAAPFFTEIGIYGILGLSSRQGMVPELFSPLVQLPKPHNDGHLIHVDPDGDEGFILLGDPAAWLGHGPDVTVVTLMPDTPHPNVTTAWRDDTIEGCFFVNDSALDPPCTELVLDSGSSADVIYARTQQTDFIADGLLAPGVEFRAEIGGNPIYHFMVGDFPMPSEDLVFVDPFEPFAILGVRVFLENDVGIRFLEGQLLLRSNAIPLGLDPQSDM
jgi:hypothetical protein